MQENASPSTKCLVYGIMSVCKQVLLLHPPPASTCMSVRTLNIQNNINLPVTPPHIRSFIRVNWSVKMLLLFTFWRTATTYSFVKVRRALCHSLSWVIFQFNQTVSPIWSVSAEAVHNEGTSESTPHANATLWMHGVIVFFPLFCLSLPLSR